MKRWLRRVSASLRMSPRAIGSSGQVIRQSWELMRRAWREELPMELFLRQPGSLPEHVPFTLALHWLCFLGIALRFAIHIDEYWEEPLWLGGIITLAFLFLVYLASMTAIHVLGGRLATSERFLWFQITADVVLFSYAYFLTRTIESDFFLFYAIPVTMAAGSLDLRRSARVLAGILIALGLVVLALWLNTPELPLIEAFARVFLIRSLAVAVIGLTYSFYRLLERGQRDTLAAIVNALGHGLIITGKDSMKPLFANELILRVVPDARIGLNFDETVHNPVKEVFETERPSRAITHCRVQDEVKHLDLVSTPLWDNRGRVVAALSVISDVTEHLNLVDIVEQMNAGICVLDTERHVVWMNEILQNWYPDAEIGQECHRAFAGLDSNGPCDCYPETTSLGSEKDQYGRSRASYPSRDPQGRVRHLDLTTSPWKEYTGSTIGTIQVISDVTFEVEMDELEQFLSSPPFDEVVILDFAIEKVVRMLQADHCAWAVVTENGQGRSLDFRSESNQRALDYYTRQNVRIPLEGSELDDRVILEQQLLAVTDFSSGALLLDPVHSVDEFDTQFALFAPITLEGHVSAVLCVESADPRESVELDLARVAHVVDRVQTAIERRRRSDGLARETSRLRVLEEMSKCLLAFPAALGSELEEILRVVLAGITAEDGLGFERAFLVIVDQEKQRLRGSAALGPVDVDEGRTQWKRFPRWRFSDIVGSDCRVTYRSRSLSQRLLTESLPLESIIPSLLGVLQGRKTAVLVRRAQCPRILDTLERLDLSTFAVAPLFAATETGSSILSGVVVADYPITRRAISDEDLKWLSAFAKYAADVIENARFIERLVSEERLALLGQAAAGIAHEMRDPLTVIKTRAQLLAKKTDAEYTHRAVEQITRNVDRVERIIKDQLLYVKQIQLGLKTEDLSALIEELIAEQCISEALSHNNVNVEVQKPKDAVRAEVDAHYLNIALSNIVRNGIEAMPDGGSLKICVKDLGREAAIEVQDTGSGIPKTEFPDLQLVFEPFVSTKVLTSQTGTGLGLSIAKKTIEAHGGTISVENVEGEGARFRIVLPKERQSRESRLRDLLESVQAEDECQGAS
jgi:signal transduction histidine kinase/PAS domain-containing protein